MCCCSVLGDAFGPSQEPCDESECPAKRGQYVHSATYFAYNDGNGKNTKTTCKDGHCTTEVSSSSGEESSSYVQPVIDTVSPDSTSSNSISSTDEYQTDDYNPKANTGSHVRVITSMREPTASKPYTENKMSFSLTANSNSEPMTWESKGPNHNFRVQTVINRGPCNQPGKPACMERKTCGGDGQPACRVFKPEASGRKRPSCPYAKQAAQTERDEITAPAPSSYGYNLFLIF